MIAKVDDEVSALTGSDFKVLKRHWRRQEALVRSDLMKRHFVSRRTVDERQIVEAGVGTVQHSQPIFSGLDLEIREQFPVHQNRVAENLGNPWRLVIGRNGI